MDKERDTKKIKEIIDKTYGESPTAVLRNRLTSEYRVICNEEVAKAIVEAGYGDTNQAKIEVLEKLKERIYKAEHPYACVINELLSEEHKAILDELLAEVTGE